MDIELAHKKFKIAIASDHAGVLLKERLTKYFAQSNLSYTDYGPLDPNQSVDYPDYAKHVADSVASGEAEYGILICGSGIGMSIAANRNPKIRAAICLNGEMAKLSRQHNNANILVLGARLIEEENALICVDVFLNTEFAGGRHIDRLNKINN